MADRGFVYVLTNNAMPCYYKIGRTSKLPSRRAAELSATSGVPDRFRVMCYVEVENAKEVERGLHNFLADFRPNFEREFFMFRDEHLPWLVGLFEHHPRRISFERRKVLYTPAVQTISPWPPGSSEPEMTNFGPIAFLDVEPV